MSLQLLKYTENTLPKPKKQDVFIEDTSAALEMTLGTKISIIVVYKK